MLFLYKIPKTRISNITDRFSMNEKIASEARRKNK